jgi:3-oxoacid CoA-transferase subunit A
MDKVIKTADEAIADIPNGAVIMIGGFGLSGQPLGLVDALIRRGVRDLTVIGNEHTQWSPFLKTGQLKKMISSFTTNVFSEEMSRTIEEMVRLGKLEVDTVPQGTLAERIRAGGMGIAGFYVKTGVGTPIEQGKEKKLFNGEEYVLELALKADFGLIKGYKADRFGNIVCRLATRTHNTTMATAADITIAEVEEIVEPSELDPEKIHIPGIFVDRVVKLAKKAKWMEVRDL